MTESFAHDDALFDVETPLGFRVRTTVAYWTLITTVKHPVMRDREADVQATLSHPDEVHLSKSDPQVYLFYRSDGTRCWVCAVTKRLEEGGFLVTAYRTSAIKEGVRIWPK
jgi:hypothetical protein